MDLSAFINHYQFNDEARKELKTFIEYLAFKGKIKNKKRKNQKEKKQCFDALSLDTVGFKFNRDEANER